MTKTYKNLNNYADAIIFGFEHTYNTAKENNWKFVEFANIIDDECSNFQGALLFAQIYENKITGEQYVELRDKVFNAKYDYIRKFTA